MGLDGRETEELLRRVAGGDRDAAGRLLERHRGRLRRLVARRLDRRVAARLDPSDVVQDAMGIACLGVSGFARERPVPFSCWLRRQALTRLGWLHRFHLGAGKRSAAREACERPAASGSVGPTSPSPPDPRTGPSEAAARDDECELVRSVLARLAPADREVLTLRYIERLSMAEIGVRLGVGADAAKMRHARALRRFRRRLEGDAGGPAS
ncbi:RNA polymerase sigma factor CnrH [Aquisphaera giovannonii]|uniref:RNA polymerase sigma factor CnrH n=1 Tax=Aquisphaera giovannonii TaxID=406548 RepID=A0A5B9VVP4_9BACT|nr:sigma-70 family RNA polymerase sigma factor [Aquisphaera giovannonii]QEH32312.1 RNA polymerase sigma factor CnrH [Aquisphaera giovannonii]